MRVDFDGFYVVYGRCGAGMVVVVVVGGNREKDVVRIPVFYVL